MWEKWKEFAFTISPAQPKATTSIRDASTSGISNRQILVHNSFLGRSEQVTVANDTTQYRPWEWTTQNNIQNKVLQWTFACRGRVHIKSIGLQ